MKKSRFYLGLGLASIFGAGAVTGAMVASRSSDEAHRKPPCHKSMTDRITSNLAAALELNGEQRVAVEPIVRKTCSRLTNIYYHTMGMAYEAMEECHDEIRPFLDPQQLDRLASYRSERRQYLKKECGFPGREREKISCDVGDSDAALSLDLNPVSAEDLRLWQLDGKTGSPGSTGP